MNDKDVVQILHRNKTALEVAQWPPQISRDDVRQLITDIDTAISYLDSDIRADCCASCAACGGELMAGTYAYCKGCAEIL